MFWFLFVCIAHDYCQTIKLVQHCLDILKLILEWVHGLHQDRNDPLDNNTTVGTCIIKFRILVLKMWSEIKIFFLLAN